MLRREEGIALIVFDLTKLKTYDQINKSLSNIRHFNLEDFPYVLIGNKPSLLKKDGFFIFSDDAKQFAKDRGCVYLEVSSEINNDIDRAFNQLAKKILSSQILV